MNTLNGVEKIIFLDINNSLSGNIITEGGLTVNEEFGRKSTAGMRPGPGRTSVDGDGTAGTVEGITVTGSFGVMIELTIRTIDNRKFINGALEVESKGDRRRF